MLQTSIAPDELAGGDTTVNTAIIDFTKETLKSRFILSVSELKELLSMQLVLLPPRHVLGAGVSDYLLEQALIQTGIKLCTANSRGEALYANPGTGDEYDYVRKVIIELLVARPAVRLTMVRKQLESAQRTVSDDVIRRVLKEYCVTSGGTWHMKGCKS